MRIINLTEQAERTDFVMKAAGYFAKNHNKTTYTTGAIEADALFAIRWGLGQDCVLVFRIADEPELYEYVIQQEG